MGSHYRSEREQLVIPATLRVHPHLVGFLLGAETNELEFLTLARSTGFHPFCGASYKVERDSEEGRHEEFLMGSLGYAARGPFRRNCGPARGKR